MRAFCAAATSATTMPRESLRQLWLRRSISTVRWSSPEERFPNRREEAALFVIDRIIQADRDSAQRSPYLARLWPR